MDGGEGPRLRSMSAVVRLPEDTNDVPPPVAPVSDKFSGARRRQNSYRTIWQHGDAKLLPTNI